MPWDNNPGGPQGGLPGFPEMNKDTRDMQKENR
jgi:hypothetical protein